MVINGPVPLALSLWMASDTSSLPVPVSPTTYLGFNDEGSLFAANKGPFNWRGPAGQLNDTGTQLNNLNQFSLIQVPLERHGAFGRAVFAISDDVQAYAQFHWQFGGASFFPMVNQGELAALYCWVSLYLAFAGPGAWAVDHVLKRKTDLA